MDIIRMFDTQVLVFIVAMIQAVKYASTVPMIPTTVISSKLTPEEGSRVSFTCNFNLSEGKTLLNVVWYFGPEQVTATPIVDWRYIDPGNVYYNNGYSDPTYTMSIDAISSGQTVLTIDPVRFQDEGSFGCNPVTEGYDGFAYATIQIIRIPSVMVYTKEGGMVERGSTATLVCNYTKSSSDRLVRLGWSHGNEFDSSSNLADFFLYREMFTPETPKPIRYYDPIGPPGYEMKFNDIDNGPGGSSSLIISSASSMDNRRYWCAVSFEVYTSNPREYVDLTVLETSDLRIAVSIVEGNLSNGIVLLGSKVKLRCDYIYDTNTKIESVAWALQETENDFSPIGTFIPGLEPPIGHFDGYNPPDYVMEVREIGPGSGYSEFTIAAANWTDTRAFWCIVTLRNHEHERSFLNLIVTDTVPDVTTSSVSKLTKTSQSFTPSVTAHLTTEVAGKDVLTVVHVGANVVVITWRSFNADINDTINQFGVFYKPDSDASGTDNSVVFVTGDENIATIPDLTPNTMYHIRVEAYTKERKFVNVGAITVTTAGDNAHGSGSMILIIGIAVASFIIILVAVVLIVVCLARRRSSSSPKKNANDNEYEHSLEEAQYQELQSMSLEKPHVYQKPMTSLPPLPPQNDEYEIPESENKTEYMVPDVGPESPALDDPALDRIGLANQTTPVDITAQDEQYKELDTKAMEKPVAYEALTKTESEYMVSDVSPESPALGYPALDIIGLVNQTTPTDITAQGEQYKELDSKTVEKPVAYEALTIMSTDEDGLGSKSMIIPPDEEGQYQDLDQKTMEPLKAYEELKSGRLIRNLPPVSGP